jgi:hypothetical protein
VVRRGDFSELLCRTLHMREQLIDAHLRAVVSAGVGGFVEVGCWCVKVVRSAVLAGVS